MGGGSKKLIWAGAGGAFLLVLLLAVAVIVPRIVDSAWLQEKIRAGVAEEIKGDFDFKEAELTILPHPAVSLQQASLAIPDTAQVNLETLQVFPRLLPLLVGKIAISKVVVESPNLSFVLPGKQGKTKKEKSLSITEILDNAGAKLVPILSVIPGLKIGVQKGTLRLFAEDEQVLQFENINGEFYVSSKSLTTAISCTSTIWESLELEAAFIPATREGKGKIALKNLNTKVLTDNFPAEKYSHVDGSLPNMQASFSVSPKTGLAAEINTTDVSLTTLHENKKIKAQVGNLKGTIHYSDQRNSITVDALSLSEPRAQLSGSFVYDKTAPQAGLDIKTKTADIAGIRAVLPVFIETLFGEIPVVREIFEIIRGGTVTGADFQVAGKSLADLAEFESMQINGHIAEADISLSDLGLNLHEVSGDVAIDKGILTGRNIQAKLGNTTGSAGSLKLGLAPKETTPFHLEIDLTADLSEVPPLIKKLVPKKQVLESLALIESIEGTVKGRLTLGESIESLSVRADANTITAQAKYKAIPYPVSVNGGRILYDGQKTETHAIQGTIGKSTFTDYSSRMNFAGEPTIEVQSGTFHVVLDEILPWLKSNKKLEGELQNIKKTSGIADITVKSIKGPLLQPASLQYELQCSLQNIVLTAAHLPGPLTIASGQASIVPDKVTSENLRAELLDSSLTYSGVLQNFISSDKMNAAIIVTEAEIGPKVNDWLAEQVKIPKEYILRTPLLISRANAKWTMDDELDLQGDFSIRKGPVFFVDIMRNNEELHLRNLSLKNDNETASIKLGLKKREIEAEFQGALSKKTIDAILLHNDYFPDAWINGDIKIDIKMDSPNKSSASGKLDGHNFVFPWELNEPLLLDSFSLTASDKTIKLNAAEAVFAKNNYSINGQASLARNSLSMDFDVRTPTVELAKILGALKNEGEDKKEPGIKVGESWDLKLLASISLHADSLHYNGYTWKPFESLVSYEDSAINIEVLKAELCNIATPGKVSLHDGQIALDLQLAAADQEFKDVLICLEGGKQQMTGTLDLQAKISGQGTRDTLVNSLQGELQYSSKDGYIYQDARAAKLLYVLNVTNMFKDKIPDLRSTGFHYDSLFVRGTMENGILTLGPARLDAPIMEIAAHGTIDFPEKNVDLQVLVAPLQTLNKLQKLLPVISKIVPESLVAVPVEVKGGFDDIKVNVLSMSAISRSTFGIMVDALSTPVRVLEDTSGETK